MKIRRLFIASIIIIFSSGLFAQNESIVSINDSIFAPNYKRNTIKWNMTPFFLWSMKNINISYERVLKPYRSFSVNAGYFELPTMGFYDSLNITHSSSRGGFSISGDYRFYFKKRNRNHAPDGLYWGPYGSFHYTQIGNDIEVFEGDLAKGTLQTNADIAIFGAGVELGYQFVIKDRLTIDLIFMGPSFSVYSGKITLSGDLEIDDESEYLKAVRDILVRKFPFLPELVAEGKFSDSGFSTGMGFGMRYMIQVGYRF